MKVELEKKHAHVKVLFMEGSPFGYNEGTICVVNGLISVNRMVFRVWVHERASLNSQWLVFRIGGVDFLHCWVVDSVWLECAESLITK